MRRAAYGVLSLVLLVAGAGCSASSTGEGGSGDGTGGDPTTAESSGSSSEGSAPQGDLWRLAIAICERQAACSCVEASDAADLASCADSEYEELADAGQQAAASDGYVFDPECLTQVADCWETLACGEPAQEQCATDCVVHHMNLEANEACDVGSTRRGPAGFLERCAAGRSCLDTHGSSQCIDPSPQQEGEPCNGAIAPTCGEGLFCDEQSCGPLRPNGSSCSTRSQCESGRCLAEQCEARSDVGAPCQDQKDCLDGLGCHPDDEACVSPVLVGDPCRFSHDQLPCVPNAYCGEDACEPRVADGGACTSDAVCMPGLDCHGNVCTQSEPVCADIWW